jgi:hypothetical protein
VVRERIDIRVRFRGKERLLRLVAYAGEWHAAFLTPGKTDFLTEECPAPSPPGAWLPAMQLKESELRIERPSDNVMSLGMGQLLLSRSPSFEDGWVRIRLRSIMADYGDDIWGRHGKTSLSELKADRKKQPGRQKDRDKEMDR